jgi:hypothetical protein
LWLLCQPSQQLVLLLLVSLQLVLRSGYTCPPPPPHLQTENYIIWWKIGGDRKAWI